MNDKNNFINNDKSQDNNPMNISQEYNISSNHAQFIENKGTSAEGPIQIQNNAIPNNSQNKKGRPLLLIIFVIFIVITGAVTFIAVQNSNKTETKQEKSTTTNRSSTQLTGFYAIDYDYNSLQEGGDGTDLKISHGYFGEYYTLNELPNAYWTDEEISQEQIISNEYEEANERYSHKFVENINDYIIFNLDDNSTVKEAYEKGWYAIYDLEITNFSIDTKNQKQEFDSIIKGLGKPYCVIKSINKEPINDNYTYNNVFIIYKFDDSFYLLEYGDNKNNNTLEENLELISSYWIASESMLKAYLLDNMGSNNVDSYTQSYIYQNGKDLIKE